MSADTYVIVGEVTIRYIRYIQNKFKFLLKTYWYDLIYSRQLIKVFLLYWCAFIKATKPNLVCF